jgi:XTP/dITP diphosphohydrolase
MKVIAATQNRHKLKELRKMTEGLGIQILSQEEAGLAGMDIEEDGDTFEANSRKKAEEIMKASGLAAIADDSGLMTEALGGAPGVYSARFAGEGATDARNNAKLLGLMKGVTDRRARFVSVITLVYADGRVLSARGECPGVLTEEERGSGGFGYDPLFMPDGFQKTFGELTEAQKNTVSHRAKAMASLRQLLSENGEK